LKRSDLTTHLLKSQQTETKTLFLQCGFTVLQFYNVVLQ
jgi:hypothetical protein